MDFYGWPGVGPPFAFGWYWHDWNFDQAATTPITHYDADAEIVLLMPEQAKK